MTAMYPSDQLFRAPDADAVGATLHVRVFDADPSRIPSGEKLLDWYRAAIQPSYLQNNKPYGLLLEPVDLRIDERRVQLERTAVVFPHLSLMEVIVFLPVAGTDHLLKYGAEAFDEGSAGDLDVDPSRTNSLNWYCDMAYLELTGKRVRVIQNYDPESGPYRTDASVLFFERPDVQVEVLGRAGKGTCIIGRLGELAVTTSVIPRTLADTGDYAVIAAAATRARHLVGRLHRRIDTTGQTARQSSPWETMVYVAEIQAAAISTRGELTGRAGYFFSTFPLQRAYKAVAPTFGVPPDDLEAFNKSLDHLDGLASTLFGLAFNHAQRRLGVYGLIFAISTLAFASIAMIDFAQAGSNDRIWAIVAYTITLCTFGLAVAALRRNANRLLRQTRTARPY